MSDNVNESNGYAKAFASDAVRTVLPNVENVHVAQNELVSRFTINRNIRKLLKNDIALSEYYKQIFGGTDITEYRAGSKYQNGQLVWFKAGGELYLLRKISKTAEDASEDPNSALTDLSEYGTPQFERHGWKNENKLMNILEYGIYDKLRAGANRVYSVHQSDTDLHPFGKLGGDDAENVKKLLFTDASNVKLDRQHVFYPYRTVKLSQTASILNGYVRIWDCGLLEFDIVYRFGYAGYDSETGMDVINCNSKVFSLSKNRDNINYFNTVDDVDIFAPKSENPEKSVSEIGNMLQTNRNDYVNTYTADIVFPKLFTEIDGETRQIYVSNADYMIFGSGVLAQDNDSDRHALMTGSNCITYCDRSTAGFTALLVTYPVNDHYTNVGYNATHGGLASNSFHCTVVGKWKTIK